MHITRLLQSVRGFQFQDLSGNRFVLRFNHHLDYAHSMEGAPWSIDRCAMLLRPLEEGMDPNLIEVNFMTIMVRLHNFPIHLQSDRVISQVGASLGIFMEMVMSK